MTDSESSHGRAATQQPEPILRLVTIGVPLGITTNLETQERQGMLRQGRQLLNFDVDAYEVVYRASVAPVRRAHLAEWATSNRKIENANAVIERCVEADLLREIDFSNRSARQEDDRWEELRLQPIGLGMGSGASGRCQIKVPDGEAAEVNAFTYSLWGASDGRSIQEVVDDLAREVGPERLAFIVWLGVAKLEDAVRWAESLDPTLATDVLTMAIPGAVLDLLNIQAAHLDKTP